MTDGMELLYDSLDLGAAQGRRPKAELSCEIVRELGEADLPLLMNPPPVAVERRGIQKVRFAHHQLARFLALGKTQEEASLLTGYEPAYISTVKNDPAFRELVAYYAANEEAIYVETTERMRQLGLSCLDELQERMETERSEVSRAELRQMIELLLIKPQAAKAGVMSGSRPVSNVISVSFVKPQQRETSIEVIEVESIDVLE